MDFGNDNEFNKLLKFINSNNMCVIFVNLSLDILKHSNNTFDFNIENQKNLEDVFGLDVCKKLKSIINRKRDVNVSLVINKGDVYISISHINGYITLTLEKSLGKIKTLEDDISERIRNISSSSILAINSIKPNKYTDILKINNYRILRYINHLDFMNTDLFKAAYDLVNLNEFFNDVNIAVSENFKNFKIIINENDINIYLDIEKFYIAIYSLISDILINSDNMQIDIIVKDNNEYLYIYFQQISDIIKKDTLDILYKFTKLHDGMLLDENFSKILCLKKLDLGLGLFNVSPVRISGVNISHIELSEALIRNK